MTDETQHDEPGPPDEAFWSRAEAQGATVAADEAAASDATAPATAQLAVAHALAAAQRADARLRGDAVRALTAAIAPRVPSAGPWRRAWTLLVLRGELANAPPDALEALDRRATALASEVPAIEPSTRARALHLCAVIALRRGRFAQAEQVAAAGLEALDARDAPASLRQLWVVDTFAQALLAQGAWREAELLLDAVATQKAAYGDALGVAISRGHQARLRLELGDGEGAARVLRPALADHGARLDTLARLRLQTLLVQSALDAEPRGGTEPCELAREASALEALVREITTCGGSAARSGLVGFAALALARVACARSDPTTGAAWLVHAGATLTHLGEQALLACWEARLFPARADEPGWLEQMRGRFARAGVVTEAEIETLLLLAARAPTRDQARARLDEAAALATTANHPGWLARVDHALRANDPAHAADVLVRRYTGRDPAEVLRTERVEATIVFADLVGFTPRAQTLSPEDVMATARGVFELATPVMTGHRVLPLSYMGDGLLAIAEGAEHRRRGLSFACELLARAARASLARRALGIVWGLEMRAGVATGPVVKGALGSLLKLEFAAIGMTTNLAARLQAVAAPGEVVCSEATAQGVTDSVLAGADVEFVTLELKGVAQPQRVVRLRARHATEAGR